MSGHKGMISKIQRYSTKDGPGLRSTVFMMGCNLQCAWCSNPELIDDGVKILYHPNFCTKCGRCAEKAKSHSIKLTDGGCVIDRDKCTNLDECASVCYFDAYETVGYEIGAGQLADTLRRDKAFYDRSGGGVTFSGGEAALQDAFIIETAKILHEDKIHVALDTAGFVPWEDLKKIIENVDMVLYDIKAADPRIHKEYTGVDNRLILENAEKIACMNVPMIIRLIIVPGINDSYEEVMRRLQFIKTLGEAVKQVDLLKYHKLGESKRVGLGIKNKMEGTSELSDKVALEYLKIAQDMGFHTTIGG